MSNHITFGGMRYPVGMVGHYPLSRIHSVDGTSYWVDFNETDDPVSPLILRLHMPLSEAQRLAEVLAAVEGTPNADLAERAVNWPMNAIISMRDKCEERAEEFQKFARRERDLMATLNQALVEKYMKEQVG